MSSNAKAVVRFLPLLAIYIIAVVLTTTNHGIFPSTGGDETAYIEFATNLIHGQYTSADDPNLWWGPGYPIILTPFALLHIPWHAARLLNAFLLFFAVIYFYQTLRLYTSSKYVLHFSYIFGLYPPFSRYLCYLMTETLAVFLICGLIYHFCKLSQQRTHNKLHQALAGICFGYLALTKVLYGYVIVTSLAIALLVFIFKRDYVVKKAIGVCLIAFIVCLPYLFYTYSLTGRVFYWASTGGVSLYWLSTPYDGESGDWGPTLRTRRQWLRHAEEMREVWPPQFLENHLAFFDRVSDLPFVAQDDAFKKAAIENIKNHPVKYFKNWLTNLARMFFEYPNSYKEQRARTLFWITSNSFVFVFVVLGIYPTWRYRKITPTEIHAILVFGLIAVGGGSLVSTSARHFYIIVPVIALGIFSVLLNTCLKHRPTAEMPTSP